MPLRMQMNISIPEMIKTAPTVIAMIAYRGRVRESEDESVVFKLS